MGLLDDAIREHLELKRRRGADPSEIDRLEREALGPVRRGPEAPGAVLDEERPSARDYPAEEEVAGWSEPIEDPPTFDHTSEAPSEVPVVEQVPEPPEEIQQQPAAGYEGEPAPAPERPVETPRHHEIAEEWEAHQRQAAPSEPGGLEPDVPAPAPPAPAPAAEPDHTEHETVEYEIESEEPAHPGAGETAEGEDVLEETPDFLQDAPDHDRLWFEQRPPRDFDFDG
jgi:hypothetical protein